MIPHLTYRGRLVLATSLLLLFAGALLGNPPLVELAGAILIALLALHLMFYPTAILLRRKKVELSWWVPAGDQPGGTLAVERAFSLHIAFRNHGSRRLRIHSTRVLSVTGLAIDERPSATVGRGQQVELTATVHTLAAGYHVLHGAALTFVDGFNLFAIEAFFPNPIAVKVFPRALPLRGRSTRSGGAHHEQIGFHTVKRRGLSGELREIREHTHGDPFKFIAWKASARRRQLMVRDLENEIVTTQVILVDVGGGMRQGPIGKTPLDWACDVAAALGRAAINNGDRVGLVGYDTRPVVELAAGTGHHHYLKLVDRLLDTRSVVDADLTDITAGELVSLVARYLAHQEAADVRVRTPPALTDPRWSRIQAGQDGQLYDLAVTAELCDRLCEATLGKHSQALKPHATSLEDARLLSLRRFCRLRGIELPYRMSWEYGMRAAGLAAAAERIAGKARPDVVVLLSDLVGLSENEVCTKRALARLRSAAGKLVAIVPAADAFLPAATTPYGARVRSLLIADQQAAVEPGRRLLQKHGVTVLDGSPAASLDQLLNKPRAA